MSEQIRVGVIGTGLAAQYLHLPSFKSHPGAHLSAICGRDRNRAAEMAAKFEIAAVYTDYREMIAKAGLDAVVVATPDDLHYPMTMAALEAGLHVLCEKPLANDAAQARAMYQKAEATRVQHMVFLSYPWQPHYRYVHQLLADGYVGRPRHCQMRYVGGYGRNPAYSWHFDAQRANGALGNLGSHLIHFARQYVGEIAGSAHTSPPSWRDRAWRGRRWRWRRPMTPQCWRWSSPTVPMARFRSARWPLWHNSTRSNTSCYMAKQASWNPGEAMTRE